MSGPYGPQTAAVRELLRRCRVASPQECRTAAVTRHRIATAGGREPAHAECWAVALAGGRSAEHSAAGDAAWRAADKVAARSGTRETDWCYAVSDAARAVAMADVLPAWALEVLTRPVVRAGLLDLDVTRAAGIDRERDHERAVHAYADSIGAPRGCRPRELCESGDHWARPDAWEHEADLLVLDPGTTAKAAAVRLRRSPGAVCSRRRRLLGRYGRRETGRG